MVLREVLKKLMKNVEQAPSPAPEQPGRLFYILPIKASPG
jgi:hypothetical protein